MDASFLEPAMLNEGVVTFLCEIAVHDPVAQKHCIRTALKGRFMRFFGNLPQGVTVALIINAKLIREGTQLNLHATEDTVVFPRPYVDFTDLQRVAEVCAGAGFLGFGLEHSGFQVVAKCDWNSNMLRLASQLHPAVVHTGDVCTDSLLIPLCTVDPKPGTLAAGISCQPYSRLGDRRHELDQRSMTLPGVLRLGFLCRFGAVILECVDEAHKCAWVQSVIRQFAQMTGYQIAQGVLHLHAIWPTRRSRWWCIITHPALGQVPWIPMPMSTAKPLVADLLDHFKECTEQELEQLALDLYELGKFAMHGFEKNEIPWRGQMQTSLHSCGSQLGACPCGCRKFGFHDDRLMQKGLHGLLVRLPGTAKCGTNTYPCFRHVHPAELALLNGMNPNMQWGNDHKMVLCALGQLASPIQSTWVGSMLMKHLQTIQGSSETIQPHQNLLGWISKVLQGRDEVFGPQVNPNAKHFDQLVMSGVYATRVNSNEAETTFEHAPTNGIPAQVAYPATEDAGEDLSTHAEPSAHPAEPTVELAAQVPESSNKRNQTDMPREDSSFMQSHSKGGVFGFENRSAKKPRVHEKLPMQTQHMHMLNMPHDSCDHPISPKESSAMTGVFDPNQVNHAKPPPRPGCGGPVPTDVLTVMKLHQPSCPVSHAFEAAAATDPSDVRCIATHHAKQLTEVVSKEVAELQSNAYPLPRPGCGGSNANLPTQPGEHPLPRPGCGGLTKPSASEVLPSHSIMQNCLHSQGPVQIDQCLQPQPNAVNFDAQAVNECPVTLFQAMPLSRLGCGGPPHDVTPKDDKQHQDDAESTDSAHLHIHLEDQARRVAQTAHAKDVPADHAHPHPFHAMPLPRLGCGGPAPVASIPETKDGNALTEPGSSLNTMRTQDTHQQQSGVPYDAAQATTHRASLTMIGSSPADTRHAKPDADEFHVTHHEHEQDEEAAETSERHQAATQPHDAPPTLFYAKPLPRLGCGGPSPDDDEDGLKAESKSDPIVQPMPSECMVIFAKHPEAKHPKPFTVDICTTPGKLTHAEAKLGALKLPIAPRSLVGTHLPLDTPLQQHQYVMLSETMPTQVKCPFLCAKYAAGVNMPDLKLPCTRFEALWNQQAWVAKDEMTYYLGATQYENMANPFPPTVFASEAAACEWADEWLSIAIGATDLDKPWCSAAIVSAHWIPIVLHQGNNKLKMITTPEGSCFIPAATKLAHALGMTIEVSQRTLPQAFPGDCGFQALAWIIAMINGHELAAIPAIKAEQWRHLFVRELCKENNGHDVIHHLDIGGTKLDVKEMQQLTDLLHQHGVWPERTNERASQVASAIPAATNPECPQCPAPMARPQSCSKQCKASAETHHAG
jgi:hypothetical protein